MTLYSQRYSPEFFDPWEVESLERRAEMTAAHLDEYIEYCRRCLPYYRRRLEGYDSRGTHPLSGVPVMTAADTHQGVPPLGDYLVAAEAPDYTVFQSGGTTGMPKTVLFSDAEIEALAQPNGRGFFAVGLEPSDRVANLWAVGSLYMTFIHIHRMLQQYGCTNFPFTNNTPADFIRAVTTQFGINCFTGITSSTLACLREMSEHGTSDLHIDKVYYGGEHIYEADKRELEGKFGVKVMAAPGYGTVDTWYIGYQCRSCPTAVFHAHDDQTFIEIVDEENGKNCDAGEVGMLYATPFPRRATPIVRYRVGDRARWLGTACRCGRTTPLFHLLGRGDDILRIGYDSLDYGTMQTLVTQFAGLTGGVQMEKKREQGRDRFVLRIETALGENERSAVAARLMEKLLAERPTLREQIHKGAVLPVTIELVRIGALPHNPRTGKLIRVIDAKET